MEPDQLVVWIVLVAVLALVAAGRFRIEQVAMGGLLLLGLWRVAPGDVVFSGFGHPALATIVAVFFISQGIINSGITRGLGQNIARYFTSTRGQIIGISALGAVLSAFINNVGAAGLMLPTVVRMAQRCKSSAGSFGLPLAFAAILGGSLTLIGSAPNIIIASFMMTATGQTFKMFDYAPHGVAMLGIFYLIWLVCKSCGLNPGAGTKDILIESDSNSLSVSDDEHIQFSPLATRERRIILIALLPAIILVSLGLIHPAFGFGGAVIILFIGRVLKASDDYKSVDLGIVFFLGAMLGIGKILEYTGGLDILSNLIAGSTGQLSPFWLIVLFTALTALLSNAINNAAAAVFMAPLAVNIAAASGMEVAAGLMAVAAGANLTLLLPTHQATLIVLSKAPFSKGSFIRFGVVLTVFCVFAASATIYLVWQ